MALAARDRPVGTLTPHHRPRRSKQLVQRDPIANRALNELMHHYTVAEEKSPTLGKGAHAEQRGVSEQQCDKNDQRQEKPPVKILALKEVRPLRIAPKGTFDVLDAKWVHPTPSLH
jgi:hypothetical protein